VLNPKAWTDPGPGQFGTSAAYYDDYRYQRHPTENMSLARNFRIKEKYNLQIRAEFVNIFNRAQINDPAFGNADQAPAPGAGGSFANGQGSGFGYIATPPTAMSRPPRQGTLVARFTF
jgi:hypothetical protein